MMPVEGVAPQGPAVVCDALPHGLGQDPAKTDRVTACIVFALLRTTLPSLLSAQSLICITRQKSSGIMSSSESPAAFVRDKSTLSNYQDIRTDNIDLEWEIDWDKKTIGGKATLKLEAVKNVDEVVLDTSYLDIKKVTVDGKEAVSLELHTKS